MVLPRMILKGRSSPGCRHWERIYYLGGVSLRGNQEFRSRHQGPLPVFHRAKGDKVAISGTKCITMQPTQQLSNNENLLNRQTRQGYPVPRTRLSSQFVKVPLEQAYISTNTLLRYIRYVTLSYVRTQPSML